MFARLNAALVHAMFMAHINIREIWYGAGLEFAPTGKTIADANKL
jgi:hypothetical protein